MRKRTVIIATLATLLVLVISPMSVLAQNDEDATVSSQPPVREALAIVAPWVTPVGQEISMRVFLRANQEPFSDAGVWALTQENTEALKVEMAALKEDAGLAAEEPDREALMNSYGTFLGRTGTDGRLYHTFEETGSYVLVAFTAGYAPGFTRIRVKSMLDALVIEAPRKAEVDEKVTITVFQRGTLDPVNDAGVWALTREQAESLKAEMESMRETGDHEAVQAALEEAVNIRGIFLGTTNGSGKVMYVFTEPSGYLLVAFKQGYFPGFAPIGIRAPDTVDALESQESTQY